MISTELLSSNLLSPVVLAFALGMLARLLRSDLEIPNAIQSYLSIFLLLAIGLKGGVALRGSSPENLLLLIGATVVCGMLTAFSAYWVAKTFLRDSRLDAASLAAHYGSVSAVTFIAAQQFTERSGLPADPVLVALVVALEIPAILMGLAIAKGGSGLHWHHVREVLTGKTALLLLGGMAIGAISTSSGVSSIEDMYFELFQGMLMLFMLDMGMTAAAQLRQVGREALPLLAYGTLVPLVHGLFGVLVANLLGLGVSSATVFGTMTASASYIAAPASIRASLPEANVGRCITAALGITFPFNLAIGIPLYAAFAAALATL
jgi:uncharacterized protein